jgi:hypothetical protein
MLPVKASAAHALPQPKPKSAARTALHNNLLRSFISLPPQKFPVKLLIIAASTSDSCPSQIRSGKELSMADLQAQQAIRQAKNRVQAALIALHRIAKILIELLVGCQAK